MQYWRELPETEQHRILPLAEEFFARCPTPEEVGELFTPAEYERFLRVAQEQLEAGYDVPDEFSARAKAGLLATLVMCAASDARDGDPFENHDLADFHMLLART